MHTKGNAHQDHGRGNDPRTGIVKQKTEHSAHQHADQSAASGNLALQDERRMPQIRIEQRGPLDAFIRRDGRKDHPCADE